MELTWVAGEQPHPARTGLHTYTGGLVGAVVAAGARVTALGMARTDVTVDDPPPWRTSPAAAASPLRSLLGPLPNVTAARATPAARAALEAVLDERRPDAVVLDHLQSGWALGLVPRGTALVHVAHNHEASTRRAIASAAPGGPHRRAVLLADAAKAARLERRVVAAADLVTAISEADAERFAAQVGADRVLLLSPGHSGHRVEARTIDADVPRRVLVLGSLDWHVKQANLLAFLAEADPVLADAGIEVHVVGGAPEAFVQRHAPALRATTFLGRVDDLAPVLAGARVGVVSEPSGGGFKLKTLDYAFGRVPMAVLDGSVAGLPLAAGEGMLVRPDNASLAVAVRDLVDDLAAADRLQQVAYDRCQAAFDWGARGRSLVDGIEQVLSGRS